jgi:hypothetical protein
MNSVSKTLKSVLVAVSFLGLVACEEIKIKDGEIPENYVGTVGELVGVYHGRFEGYPASVELRMNGNKPQVIYRDQFGSDILHPSCGSQIGDLKLINVGTKNNEPFLKNAYFSFDAGECWTRVRGRTLTVSFFKRQDRQHLDLHILKDVRWEQRCVPVHLPPHGAGTDCRMEQVQHYISGRFRR